MPDDGKVSITVDFMKKSIFSYLIFFMLMLGGALVLQFISFILMGYVYSFPMWSVILFLTCTMILFGVLAYFVLRIGRKRLLVRLQQLAMGEELPFLFKEEETFCTGIEDLTQRLKVLENRVQLQQAIKQRYQAENVEIHLDSMTKLFTKEYLYKVAPMEISKAIGMGVPVSVLMIDVDNFKFYNDNKGHVLGDEVLIILSKLLKQSIRSDDLAVRYGGEEFLVFLPNSPKKYAVHVAQRIQDAIEEQEFPEESVFPQGRLTVSIGMASIPDDCRDLSTLIDKADQALYKAKRAGKNTIVWN